MLKNNLELEVEQAKSNQRKLSETLKEKETTIDELNSRLVIVKSQVSIKRKFKKFRNRLGVKPKLCIKDELLVILMKLRLCLVEQDLADRSKVSLLLVSRIFVTRVNGLASVFFKFGIYPR